MAGLGRVGGEPAAAARQARLAGPLVGVQERDVSQQAPQAALQVGDGQRGSGRGEGAGQARAALQSARPPWSAAHPHLEELVILRGGQGSAGQKTQR